MINEIWSDIVGYEQLYQISNFGTVKSLSNNKIKKEKILKQVKTTNGYLFVNLCKNGKRKFYQIHRLVAQAFLPNPENKPCIDHINTNKTDNRVCNLRWVTAKENMNNPLSIDKLKNKLGIKHHNSKPVLQLTLTGELIKKWNSIRDVERELGINQSNISKCCKGDVKSAGKFKWQYAN